jgi:uncharacterized protein (TIGR02246 family)
MAAETTGQATTDETAVRGLYQQLMDDWNQGSGDAFAAAFTDDGDLVAFDGTHLKGRAQIAAAQQRLFDKFLKGTRLVGSVEQVRFLGPETAVMHAVGNTVMRRKSTPSPERASIQTLVAVRRDDGVSAWRSREPGRRSRPAPHLGHLGAGGVISPESRCLVGRAVAVCVGSASVSAWWSAGRPGGRGRRLSGFAGFAATLIVNAVRGRGRWCRRAGNSGTSLVGL